MRSLWQDVRYAARTYSRNRTFTLTAIVVLAIGIGATAGLFTVVNSVLLKPLPYFQPERIVDVYRRVAAGPRRSASYPWFRFTERNQRAFEHLTIWAGGPKANLTAGGTVRAIHSFVVSSGFFGVFGVQPLVGRDFTPEDDKPGAAPVVLISRDLWTGWYAGDRQILGRPLIIAGESYTIIGVMPASFSESTGADVWIPFRKREDWAEKAVGYLVSGRLRPGVTMDAAGKDLDNIWAMLRQEHPDAANSGELGFLVIPYKESVVGDSRRPILLLGAAATCILLIACVNVANLLLARAVTRRKEIAIRVSIGTGRSRLIRQFLTESVLLAVAAGFFGLILAAGLTYALKEWLALHLARGNEVSMDWQVLSFTFATSVLTGIIFGLAPVLQLMRVDPALMLPDMGRQATSRKSTWMHATLVCAQITLSTVLLLGAGLLLTSFEKLRTFDLGFKSDGVLVVEASMTGPKFQATAPASVAFSRIKDRLMAIPGVQSVALINVLPTNFSGLFDVTLMPDPVTRNNRSEVTEEPRQITPEFFDVLRIPMRLGRAFTEQDTTRSTQVAIVNESFVREYLAGVNPIGMHVVLGRAMGPMFLDQPREIVGVVADTRGELWRMKGQGRPSIYTPIVQLPDRTTALLSTYSLSWVLRTGGKPLSFGRIVREELLKEDPSIVIENTRTLDQIVSAGIEQQRLQTALIGSFAAIALLLAAVGLYGTMSHVLAERWNELGIRSALGATGHDLLWLIMNHSLKLVAVGLLSGVAVFLALQRLISAYLFGVNPTDPVLHVVVLALLASTAVAASLPPAMRAKTIDPAILLRQ